MDINVVELKTKLENKENFFFVDVREKHEYEEFNLGAELIPLGDLGANMDKFAPHRDNEIVVHCRSGARSGMAQQLLTQAGFSNVRNLTGGVLAWIDAYGNGPVQ